jgi:hypothetical protein
LDDVLEQADGRRGIEHNSTLHASVVDGVKHTIVMAAGLVVDGKDIGTGIVEVMHIAAGVLNHQVHIEWLSGVFLDVFDDGLTEGDVGHKNAVHHVDMEPVALRCIEHLDVALKVAKVGAEK